MKRSIESLVFTQPAIQDDQLDFILVEQLDTVELKLMHMNQILWRRMWGGPIAREVSSAIETQSKP